MPQDGSGNYQYPPGTPGVPDQTIESEAYNTFIDDLITNDLNIARPLHRGGTGATTTDQALLNLTAEKATQLVTNYDSHVWLAGSFYADAAATGGPVAARAYVGTSWLTGDVANVTLEAVDVLTGVRYGRQKVAGVWGAWSELSGSVAANDARYVNVTGDTMTGPLTLPGNPAGALDAVPKQYAVAKAGDTMTGGLTLDLASPGLALSKDAGGIAYINVLDTDRLRWSWWLGDNAAESGANAGSNFKLFAYADNGIDLIGSPLAIDRATGRMTLIGDPALPLHAVPKQYVDARAAHGQVYLDVQSTTALRLSPHNGNAIKINGKTYFLTAPITTAPTNCWVAGVPGQNLVVGTAYYVAVFDFNGVLTLEFEPIAAGHVRDTAPGNVGVEIIGGFVSRTLVGMVRIGTGTIFEDTIGVVGCLSWFNRRPKAVLGTCSGSTTSTASVALAGPSAHALNWIGDAVHAALVAQGATTGSFSQVMIGVDGVAASHGQGTYIYNSINDAFQCGGWATRSEGVLHTYTLFGGASSGSGSLTVNNGMIHATVLG